MKFNHYALWDGSRLGRTICFTMEYFTDDGSEAGVPGVTAKLAAVVMVAVSKAVTLGGGAMSPKADLELKRGGVAGLRGRARSRDVLSDKALLNEGHLENEVINDIGVSQRFQLYKVFAIKGTISAGEGIH
jgi:hypothetical protein